MPLSTKNTSHCIIDVQQLVVRSHPLSASAFAACQQSRLQCLFLQRRRHTTGALAPSYSSFVLDFPFPLVDPFTFQLLSFDVVLTERLDLHGSDPTLCSPGTSKRMEVLDFREEARDHAASTLDVRIAILTRWNMHEIATCSFSRVYETFSANKWRFKTSKRLPKVARKVSRHHATQAWGTGKFVSWEDFAKLQFHC